MSTGPLSSVQLAHIAREHYVRRKSRIQIAEETGLSRFKIGRMLDEAVERGIIRFEIVASPGVDVELSGRLAAHYGLEHAVVFEQSADTDADAQLGLGAAAATMVEELVRPDDVLGLTSGRTLNVMASKLTHLPCRDVVQLAGIAGPILESGLEVIRSLAALPDVRPWPIYASLVMSDTEAAQGVRRQPGARAAIDQFGKVTVALCAVGSWDPPNSLMMINPAVTDDDRRRLRARGVAAEVASTLIAEDGEIIHDLDPRCIAISDRQLRAVRSRVAIAGGPSKTRALRAVLRSGLMTAAITDTFTAYRLLEQ
ncbi:sugar-binding transcriptional regulator [Microbacterium halotolerans]|uniref:sugar-binding transcriptional regulator n=1 Tax=Microbacterium halotolerans TaxID=246613 RepID=UPI0013C31286|nr:sugar-binding domain-containing protein [Microbacterium halotolerans]